MTEIAELFNKFGPMGLTVILMGGWSVYSARWLREGHDKFTSALDRQGERHERIVAGLSDKFTTALEKQGERIDTLADRVDELDDHVRGR
jgi:hypothetical protein